MEILWLFAELCQQVWFYDFSTLPPRPMTHSLKTTTLAEPRPQAPYGQTYVSALAFDYTEWQKEYFV